MKRKLSIYEMEFLVGEMKKAKAEFPKAEIYYFVQNAEDNEIRIVYPLPKDFSKIQVKLSKDSKYNSL